MYWHIDTDIVSLIIMSAIYIYYTKTLTKGEILRRDRYFLWCFRGGIIITLIDIAASVVMELPVPPVLYHITMSLYFICIENVILCWFFYSLSLLYDQSVERRKLVAFFVMLPYCLYALLVLSNPWTGVIFTLGPDNAYARGPLFFLMVVVYAIYAVALFILIFIRQKYIADGYSSHVLMMTPVILSISIIVQLTNPGWLMVMPGYAICLVMAFLFLETKQSRDNQVLVQHLSEAALTDPLTGLFNRAGLENQLQSMTVGHAGCKCLVAIVDIDDLKYINDTMGHTEGDRAIQAVAVRLKKHFRASDIVVRYGGDEFLVYLVGELNETWAHRSLRQLVEELGTLRIGEADDFVLHGSVGATIGVVGRDDFDALCNEADLALYNVKRHGKNSYALYEPTMKNDMPCNDIRAGMMIS